MNLRPALAVLVLLPAAGLAAAPAWPALAVSPSASAPAHGGPGGHRHAAGPSPRPTPVAALPAVPGLSIALGDGRHQVRTGDRLTYVVRVDDSGSVGVARLRVTLTLPAGVRLVTAARAGRVAGGKLTWRTRLRPGRSLRFAATARVTRTPPGVSRLAAVACAQAGGLAAPVCAAHLDTLPAAGARARGGGAAAHPGSAGSSLAYAGAGLVVLVVIGVAVAAARMRTRKRPPGVRRQSA